MLFIDRWGWMATISASLTLAQLIACGGGGSGVGPPDDGAGAVDSLVLSLDSAEVILGDTLRLTAVAKDANSQPVPGIALVWTSTDPSVATVSADGLVTAVDLGEAEIEVDIAGASPAQASLNLAAAALQSRGRSRAKILSVPKVVITPGDGDADVDQTIQYSVRVTDARGRDLPNWTGTEWSSFDPSVASIDPTSGLATALADGMTQIIVTATVRGGQYQSTVLLRVSVCGGILAVTAWDATFDLSYEARGSVPQAPNFTFSISQGSSATARLTRDNSLPGLGTVWAGTLSGTGHINNTEVIQAGLGGELRTTETGSGTLLNLRGFNPPGVPVVLQVSKRSDENTCEFILDYIEAIVYTATYTGLPPVTSGDFPFGRVGVQEALGPKPDGGWRIAASNAPLPVLFHVGNGFLPQTGYSPQTSVGLSVAEGLYFPGQAGTARFTYSLVAR